MIIGIEAERANHKQKTGVEHYAKQLILNLAMLDKENTYVLYLRSRPEEWFFNLPKNFQVKVLPFPVFWTQLRLSLELLLHPVDSLFIPASALPIYHPKNSTVTIHDLAWKYYPQTFTKFMRGFLEWSTRFALKRASHIIAVSESTKKDLVKFYKVAPEKVAVVHHGFKLENVGSGDRALQFLPEKYVLFLSTLQPRKNLQGLIEAFRKLKTNSPELPHKLSVVGKPGWKYEPILESIEKNKDIVVYLNQVSEKDKAYILKHADLLVCPSFYEGFGMQILEAFAARVPVACSNTSSLPEVAGDAAVYFNPNSPADMENAMRMILYDKSLSDGLREKGDARLKSFSWQSCAQKTLDILKSN